jgi:hypothetical protein
MRHLVTATIGVVGNFETLIDFLSIPTRTHYHVIPERTYCGMVMLGSRVMMLRSSLEVFPAISRLRPWQFLFFFAGA